jgi:hypothetical protein
MAFRPGTARHPLCGNKKAAPRERNGLEKKKASGLGWLR